MSEDPGLLRTTYRRLRSASGIADLPALETRVDDLEVAVAEDAALAAPLTELVARVEASLVPLLEKVEENRSRRAAGGSPDVP